MTNGGEFKDCPCAPIFRCPTCGPYGYESPMPDCPCMPQPSCPNCIIGKILSKYHQTQIKTMCLSFVRSVVNPCETIPKSSSRITSTKYKRGHNADYE